MSEFWQAGPLAGKGNARLRETRELALADARRLGLPCIRLVTEDKEELAKENTGCVGPEKPRPGRVGKALRSSRLARGFTRQQFAVLLGYSVNSLDGWETGKNKPSPAAESRIWAVIYALSN